MYLSSVIQLPVTILIAEITLVFHDREQQGNVKLQLCRGKGSSAWRDSNDGTAIAICHLLGTGSSPAAHRMMEIRGCHPMHEKTFICHGSGNSDMTLIFYNAES